MMHLTAAVTFAIVYAALHAAHYVGDHWFQTDGQATGKGGAGWPARLLCARHVLTLTVTKIVSLVVTAAVVHVHLSAVAVAVGLTVDAVTHYIADRRAPLRKLACLVGKGPLWDLGDEGVAPTGTGRYSLDQSWHVAWLWITALIIAAL